MKYYYCWRGQNATTGTPNPKTGRLSMWGDLISFSSKAKRDKFVDEYYNYNNPSEFCVKTNKSDARKYHLGMSIFSYNECVLSADYNVDECYNSYFSNYLI